MIVCPYVAQYNHHGDQASFLFTVFDFDYFTYKAKINIQQNDLTKALHSKSFNNT